MRVAVRQGPSCRVEDVDVSASASPTIGVVVVVVAVEIEDEAAAAAPSDTCRCRRRRRGPRRSEDEREPRGVNKRALLRMMAPPLMATNMMGWARERSSITRWSLGGLVCRVSSWAVLCVQRYSYSTVGLTGRYDSIRRPDVEHRLLSRGTT